jgi:hypothetical protein
VSRPSNLTEGVVKALFVSRIKGVLAAVVVIGLALGGIGVGVGLPAHPVAGAEMRGDQALDGLWGGIENKGGRLRPGADLHAWMICRPAIFSGLRPFETFLGFPGKSFRRGDNKKGDSGSPVAPSPGTLLHQKRLGILLFQLL